MKYSVTRRVFIVETYTRKKSYKNERSKRKKYVSRCFSIFEIYCTSTGEHISERFFVWKSESEHVFLQNKH